MAKISARGDAELARFRGLDETVEVVITASGRILRKNLVTGDGFKLIGNVKRAGASGAVARYASLAHLYRKVGP